jgi:multidrug transporter EmrE-like cation transporter
MNSAFYYVLAVVVLEVFANFNLKWYAETNLIQYIGYGASIYVAILYFLVKAFQQENVLYVNALWDGLSGLIQGLSAYIFLGDRLKSNQQYVGVLFIVTGVTLLQLGH